MTVRALGFAEFARELAQMNDEVREKVYPAIEETAEEILRDAKRRVPVDHGDLRDSLVVRGNKKKLTARVEAGYPKTGRKVQKGSKKSAAGARVYYAYAVEYGTKHQKEQPFLIPAFENAEEFFVERTAKALEEVLNGTA